MRLFIATRRGLATCIGEQTAWSVEHIGLEDMQVTSVIARHGVVLAGTRDGIYRSDDEGVTWEPSSRGLAYPHVRWLACHPEITDYEFAGTEPAGIFVSRDGGGSWESDQDVFRLRDEYGWFLPYSPESGCVRGFAFSRATAYAAVEVGGVLVSKDHGESWSLLPATDGPPRFGPPEVGRLHPDVHDLAVHAANPELLYAPTGGGFYRSYDGGRQWNLKHKGYVRAVWIAPDSEDTILLGPAEDSSGARGKIEISYDGGKEWQPAGEGTGGPWRHKMVERFFQPPGKNSLIAILSNGEIWISGWPGLGWQPALTDLTGVTAATSMLR